MNWMPFLAYSRCNWTSSGISSTHGPHQEAQKLTTTGCPLNRLSDCGLPSALVTGAAHNCATALWAVAGPGWAACASSPPLVFNRLWPAKTPTPVAINATNTPARIRLLFIVIRSFVGGGRGAFVEQRLHGLRAGPGVAAAGIGAHCATQVVSAVQRN